MPRLDLIARRARAKSSKVIQELIAEIAIAQVQIPNLLQKAESLCAEGRYREANAVINEACDLEYDLTGDCEATGEFADELEQLLKESEDEDG